MIFHQICLVSTEWLKAFHLLSRIFFLCDVPDLDPDVRKKYILLLKVESLLCQGTRTEFFKVTRVQVYF